MKAGVSSEVEPPDPGPRRALVVERLGGPVTVQDLGRAGLAHLGVPRSGAADRGALRLANRLVGNHQSAAGLEITFGGLVLLPLADLTVALTGAACPMRIGEAPAAGHSLVEVPAGMAIEIGLASSGVRCYLAVRGGIRTDQVLGSRATDTFSGIGPAPLSAGDVVPIGPPDGADVAAWPRVVQAPVAAPPDPAKLVALQVLPGPRAQWLTDEGTALFRAATWTVSPDSDRVGLRLIGPVLPRARTEDLPSEPMVRGAVQVPPSGQPVIFLADHPVTGGYPVVAVLREAACDRAAQLRPGQRVRMLTDPRY